MHISSTLALVTSIVSCAIAAPSSKQANGPFFRDLGNKTWIIGNELWNLTQGPKYGTKLYYRDRDCVGNAVGHYVSYNGAANDLAWLNASVVSRTAHSIDVQFIALEGEMHWVIQSGLAGAYQYFVNRALPNLGEFRTLWRLDNRTFPNGRTNIKDEPLPALSEYVPERKVQDETWRREDGSFITKYDWSAFIRDLDFYGVYGDEVGSWYINPGKDYYNGNHLKQELTVHRESATGDAVQLNMIHGTHFQVSAVDAFPDGKTWGPWLWYLNNGSKTDASARAVEETAAWPYDWFKDTKYQARGSVRGILKLSDGRPAAGAAVFLGDNHANKTALDMGSDYYYTTYADSAGHFHFSNVRNGTYALQAWASGNTIADVATSYLRNDIIVKKNKVLDLNTLTWIIPARKRLFQVGDFDRKSTGFSYGGLPYEHARVAKCPANLTFTARISETSDWCFAQSYQGSWDIVFEVDPLANKGNKSATLSVSLAGYSTGASLNILVNNGTQIGNLTSGAVGQNITNGLANDPSLYRSGTTAGEWRFFQFDFDGAATLKEGLNTVSFVLTRNTTWRGFMYDSVLLDW